MIRNEHTESQFSTEQRALIERKLIRKSPTVVAKPAPVGNLPRPLSPAQESLWFLDQLEPNSSLYNIPEALRLQGKLNVAALEKTLMTIFRRHDVLRTRFVSSGGKPMQVIDDNAPFQFPIVDLSHLPGSERDAAAIERVEAEAKRPFNLSCGPVWRAALFKLASDEYILSLATHHIVSDLWSFSILHQEMETLYKGFCAGAEVELPPLPEQFFDDSSSQREPLPAEVFDSQIAAWKTHLAGELTVLELPADRPRPVKQTFAGGREKLTMPGPLFTAIKEVARKEQTTPFVFLLAAFETLLHRYSHQDNFLVGTPISTRNTIESERLIGYFINMLPMRADFSGDPSFRDFLQRTRQRTLAAFTNPDIPAEKIAGHLQWPRHSPQYPLFQAVFQFSSTVRLLQLDGLLCQFLDVHPGTSKFDLTLTVSTESTSAGLTGNVEFNTDLFDAATIRRMIEHFKILVAGVIANPDRKISEVPLLSKGESMELAKWNQTATDYPRASTIHELFEAQAAQTPDATAIVFEDQKLTYAELNSRANRLARCLRKLGIGPGKMAALCIERSVEMIVGVLGILKAGGAYVTLDAGHPQERLAYMIKDTGAPVFVTTSEFKNLAGENIKTICLDKEAELLSEENENNLECDTTADCPAYVIYTSGSTGQPKAVVIRHRGVVRLVKNTNYLCFGPDDVFLQFAPISFDASTFEIFGPLLNGGRLVLFPPNFDSLEQLGEIIHRENISTLWLTAGLFHQMVEHHIGSLKNVKRILAGGDVLSVPHVLKALRELPETTLINGYGPTENTTFTCCHEISPEWRGGRSVPIGKPISNTQVYILDPQMQQQPIGITGELYIGGDGLALCYLNVPDLNTQKFWSNPFRADEKIYRTGDLARWLADGTIEFLGRADTQVKIRGFRIELAEIENALVEIDDVQEAVVVARQDNAATKQLVAYVVAEKSDSISAAVLRQLLERKLPNYMVPGAFIFLESLPLNSSGKVDRKRLPIPETANLTASGNSVGPRNAMEERLAQIWSEVLGIKEVGVSDNFFEVGGHSLLATRVVSRINQLFGVEIPLRLVFEAPTIQELAEAISKNAKSLAVDDLPVTRRVRAAISPRPSLMSQS